MYLNKKFLNIALVSHIVILGNILITPQETNSSILNRLKSLISITNKITTTSPFQRNIATRTPIRLPKSTTSSSPFQRNDPTRTPIRLPKSTTSSSQFQRNGFGRTPIRLPKSTTSS